MSASETCEPVARPFISVIIPSYNRRESLVEVIGALRDQTYPAGRFEVIVVLDGSDDGSEDALASGSADWLSVLWQPNAGAARARNRGAALARGELLVFLDDDVVPRPDLLVAHAHAHSTGVADVVIGRLLFRPTGPRTTLVDREAEWYDCHFAELAAPGHAFGWWDFFAGNVSLARKVFLDIGGFDETFTTYGCEDWELGLRLLKGNRRLAFCGDAVGEHRYGLSFASWQHHAYWDGRSEVRFVRKHPEAKAAFHLASYYQGSRLRRLGCRLLRVAPRAWPTFVAQLTRLYLWTERLQRRRIAATLLKLIGTYWHWSGLRDELGQVAVVDQFVGLCVPILVYHRVTDRPNPALAEYAVSPRTFRRQLAWLRVTGYDVISLSELYDVYRGAARLPRRSVVITFDDGYEDTATVAAPMLREFGYPATVFVVSERVGGWNAWDAAFGAPRTRLLDWDELRSLAGLGMELGSHSATHRRLSALAEPCLARELSTSRTEIEWQVSREVRWFAYPHGDHDSRVRLAVRAAGYLGACTFETGIAAAGDDLMQLPRIPVDERDRVIGFVCKLATGDDWWTAIKRLTPAPLKRVARRATAASGVGKPAGSVGAC